VSRLYTDSVKLIDKLRRIFPSLERGDDTSNYQRPVDNVDAEANDPYGLGGPTGYPPNYVKDYDDGRPRK
jgi:hypothetical protein